MSKAANRCKGGRAGSFALKPFVRSRAGSRKLNHHHHPIERPLVGPGGAGLGQFLYRSVELIDVGSLSRYFAAIALRSQNQAEPGLQKRLLACCLPASVSNRGTSRLLVELKINWLSATA